MDKFCLLGTTYWISVSVFILKFCYAAPESVASGASDQCASGAFEAADFYVEVNSIPDFSPELRRMTSLQIWIIEVFRRQDIKNKLWVHFKALKKVASSNISLSRKQVNEWYLYFEI